ncbi:MAG: hypothetical protein ACR2RF_32275 [Geminicoccaceae bacterium]
MADNVVEFDGITCLDIPPDRILERAKGELQDVIVIGYDHEGEEYFASSKADGGSVLWLLERFKKRLLEMGDDQFS